MICMIDGITYMRPRDAELSIHPKNRRRGKCRERLAFQDIVNDIGTVYLVRLSSEAGGLRICSRSGERMSVVGLWGYRVCIVYSTRVVQYINVRICRRMPYAYMHTHERNRRMHTLVYILYSMTDFTLYLYCTLIVLPPSQNSCPTSSLNRENSGIAPKRHTIRNLLNEHYPSMYMM